MKFRNPFKKKKKAPLHFMDNRGVIHLNKTREQQIEDMAKLGSMAETVFGKCKKCSGKGFTSWHTTLNQAIPCSCVEKLGDKARKEKELERKDSVLFSMNKPGIMN